MTDPATHLLHTDPSGFVSQILSDAEENGVDTYLDGLDEPDEADLGEIEDLEAMNDLEDEEIE
jgi:hypothetical protein